MDWFNKFFNNKKEPDIDWSKCFIGFNMNKAEIVHCNNISKEVHTKKKYYYKLVAEKARLYNIHMDEHDIYPINCALYIAPKYNGTKAISLDEMVKTEVSKCSNYPLYFKIAHWKEDMVFTDLYSLTLHCKDIHREADFKANPACKNIIHCVDDEDRFDIYFVFYNYTFDLFIRDYLLRPYWAEF